MELSVFDLPQCQALLHAVYGYFVSSYQYPSEVDIIPISRMRLHTES